ncbi:MAG: MgtC/SapB family protein [Lachnospiraceae bacterium]|nr:MgtC/SapB family protein [Lachnospiraceae bacterium]MBO5144064.1 MgtC/SapB family protein [Lachnospiraceae bacterium]
MFTKVFSEWTWQNILIRILTALVLGMVIGIDRGVKRRGGGARTTITVCLGAAMVMLIEQYLEELYPERFDISRIAAQVISGVGFLGAGSIIVSGHQIKGLTSAASIWTCACIGLAVGIGFIDGAVLLTALWLTGVHLVPYFEEKAYKHTRYMTLYVEVEDGKAITLVSKQLKEDNCFIDTFSVDKPKAKGQHFQIVTTFQIPKQADKEEYLRLLQALKGVISVSEI